MTVEISQTPTPAQETTDAALQHAVASTIQTLNDVNVVCEGKSDAIKKYANVLATTGNFEEVMSILNNECQMTVAELGTLLDDGTNFESARHLYLEGYIRGVKLVAITVHAKIEEYADAVDESADLPENVTLIAVPVTAHPIMAPTAPTHLNRRADDATTDEADGGFVAPGIPMKHFDLSQYHDTSGALH